MVLYHRKRMTGSRRNRSTRWHPKNVIILWNKREIDSFGLKVTEFKFVLRHISRVMTLIPRTTCRPRQMLEMLKQHDLISSSRFHVHILVWRGGGGRN